jgi:hypothetical protein
MLVVPLIKLPFQLAGLALKVLPDPKFLIAGASLLVITVQPINKQVESAWHFGFNWQVGIGPAKVSLIRIPSGQEIVKQIVVQAEEATGFDMGSWKLTDQEIICSIGASEGTRGRDCTPNPAWYGHDDPGWAGKCRNIGTFSYQHCADSPEAADAAWIVVLRKAENNMQAEAKERFGEYLSPKAIAAGLDGFTQSPHSSGVYVRNLPSANPSFEQVVEARIKALNWSRSVRGGPRNFNVRADQRRRVSRIWEQVHR